MIYHSGPEVSTGSDSDRVVHASGVLLATISVTAGTTEACVPTRSLSLPVLTSTLNLASQITRANHTRLNDPGVNPPQPQFSANR